MSIRLDDEIDAVPYAAIIVRAIAFLTRVWAVSAERDPGAAELTIRTISHPATLP